MEEKRCAIQRYSSVLYRLSSIYFDQALAPFHIGSGQQFFLLRIGDHPGISVQELARQGCYDKATAARAVQKLAEQAYIRVEPDPDDKRIHRLYLTGQAEPIIRETRNMLGRWNEILMCGIREEEQKTAERLMSRMAQNASGHLAKRKKEREWND